jgi:hypothetical protein
MSIVRIKQDAEKADEMIRSLAQAGEEQGEQDPQGEPQEPTQAPEHDQGVAQSPDPASDSQGKDWQEEARLWEQRYRSLNGMIQSRDRQIQQLHDLLAQMQSAQAPQGKEQEKEAVKGHLTKDDEDQYGADLVDMARRAAREENAALIDQLQGKISQLEGQLAGVSQVTEGAVRDRFETKLDRATNGEWRKVDQDPAFMEWLKSSQARYRVFVESVQGQDAATAAEFFTEFAKMQQSSSNAPAKRKSELERQVAPGKSKATGVPAVGEKKQWTRSEIARTYADKKQFAPDEFIKLEREIAAAQREGRVDFNK